MGWLSVCLEWATMSTRLYEGFLMRTPNEYIWTKPGTDIEIRWKQHGWVRPSTLPEYQAKWKYYKEIPLRELKNGN